jgi:sirohydrochlorin ferrochelatase
MPSDQFLLIVDHGSKRPEAAAFLEDMAARVATAKPDWQVRTAHLEVCPPDIGEAIDACVHEGAREVVIQPFFLLPGRHTREDIPAIARAAQEKHGNCTIRVGEAIGEDDQMVEILIRRAAALLAETSG